MQSIKILLVEDNAEHADLTIMALKESDGSNTIFWAESGEDALDFLYNKGDYEDADAYPLPDLVLLDIKLPNMSGLEVLKHIKADHKFCYIPIVMFTTSGVDKDVQESYQLGANSFVTKPVNFQKFLDIVRSVETYWTDSNILVTRS